MRQFSERTVAMGRRRIVYDGESELLPRDDEYPATLIAARQADQRISLGSHVAIEGTYMMITRHRMLAIRKGTMPR